MKLNSKKLVVPLILVAIFTASLSFQVRGNSPNISEEYIAYDNNQGTVVKKSYTKTLEKGTQWVNLGSSKELPLESIKILDLSVESDMNQIEILEMEKNLENGFESSIGSKVEIELSNGRRVSGVLISVTGQYMVLEDQKETIYINKENISRITMEGEDESKIRAKIRTQNKGEYKINLKYMIEEVSWEASYDLIIRNPDPYEMKLSDKFTGKIIVDNPSQKKFDGQLKLISGQVMGRRYVPIYDGTKGEDSAIQDPKKVDRVYMYNLGQYRINPSTQKTINYMEMYPNIERELIYHTSRYGRSENVQEYLRFQNQDQPLPKGNLNIYREMNGSQILVGRDQIERTPKRSELEIDLGGTYDLVGETRVLEETRYENNITRKVEITLINYSDKNESVTVRYSWNFGELIDSEIKPVEENAEYLEWKSKVNANDDKSFIFEVAENIKKTDEKQVQKS